MTCQTRDGGRQQVRRSRTAPAKEIAQRAGNRVLGAGVDPFDRQRRRRDKGVSPFLQHASQLAKGGEYLRLAGARGGLDGGADHRAGTAGRTQGFHSSRTHRDTRRIIAGQKSGRAAFGFWASGKTTISAISTGGCSPRVTRCGSSPAKRMPTGVLAGIVPRTDDWRRELPWVRAAGREGVILFEGVDQGIVQDDLRGEGYQVIGGSAFGDRLENDRAFGQQMMAEAGMRVAPVHEFHAFDDALAFLRAHRGRWVYKLNGGRFPSTHN